MNQRFAVTALAIVLFAMSAQASVAANLYRCTILQTGKLIDDGLIKETDSTKVMKTKEFVLDLTNEQLVWNWSSWHFDIIQHPSAENSLVAIRIYREVASVVVKQLRIDTWIKGMPFIYYDTNEVYSGKCREL